MGTFVLVHDLDKVKVAARVAASAPRTILFTRTKRNADRLAHGLRKEGIEYAAIHGDLPQRVREVARGLLRRLGRGAGGDRRRRPGPRHRGRRDRRALRPAEDHKALTAQAGPPGPARTGLAVTLALWNEELVVKPSAKRVGIELPIVEMFSSKPRLDDLAGWDSVTDPGPPRPEPAEHTGVTSRPVAQARWIHSPAVDIGLARLQVPFTVVAAAAGIAQPRWRRCCS